MFSGMFAAKAVVLAAQRLQDMGQAGDLSGAVEALADLDLELNKSRETLNAVSLQRF